MAQGIKKKQVDKGGRPSVMTDEVVSKLEAGFAMGFTDNEACLYANISKHSLYRYIELKPEFGDRKELLKDQPKMKAKMNVISKLNEGDDYNSRWYLERKSKDEFSLKVETDNKTELNGKLSLVDLHKGSE